MTLRINTPSLAPQHFDRPVNQIVAAAQLKGILQGVACMIISVAVAYFVIYPKMDHPNLCFYLDLKANICLLATVAGLFFAAHKIERIYLRQIPNAASSSVAPEQPEEVLLAP